ncbi:rhodanese-like domain-containing protein [Yoonia sp. 2307UL14-13]|uniref:rhodanese-like domain-containing protein n=1 Tax=Yoonia sp. 2307UL14-13 TaxID=3126506 RepID=UPI0030B41612
MPCFRTAFLAAFAMLLSATQSLGCVASYTVQSGDTLSRIALDQLGSYLALENVYRANIDVIGDDPDRINVGMRLDLPCTTTVANPVNWAVFPSADTVARLQARDAVQVLDIRSAAAVEKGVVPWSVSMPYAEWRGPRENRSLTMNADDLSRIVGAAGLRVDQPVVIIHNQPSPMDTGRAALVYWMLKSVGFKEIAIMKGGFQAWKDADLPVANRPTDPDPYRADLLFSTKWRADELDVYGIATAQVSGFLLDARPQNVFAKRDDDGEAVATTLPKARNAPIMPLMRAISADVPVETGVAAVIDHLERYDARWTEGEVVLFCQTGELGALTWFYASELAALENISLYPESAVGWAHHGGRLFVGEQ